MSTSTISAGRQVSLSAIDVGSNVRELDPAFVDELAGSIAVRGVITPLAVVGSGGGRFALVAGHHRHAACVKLGLEKVPVTLRPQEGSTADTAAENVMRKQLTPLEEARAVKAMLNDGYTLDGAAAVLGWGRSLVSARARILELPDGAQRLVGSGEIPVGAIDNLLAINAVAPALVEALIAALTAGEFAGSQLRDNVAWALARAMSHTSGDTFAAYLNHVTAGEIETLKLGKKATARLAEAEQLHKQLESYAYGPPTIRFAESDVDQARAAGVLIELELAAPIIVDRGVYRELVKQAIARTADELIARKATQADQQRELRATAASNPASAKDELDATHRAALRDFASRAHAVNLDLGAGLLNELSVVDPANVDVARFFAHGLLGPDRSSHLGVGDNVARVIAGNGIRLIVEELRTTQTPTLKSGRPGKTKVTYGDVDEAQAWMWRFVDVAKTAGEIYGRALVVYAAQHYAGQIALPTSQRRNSVVPNSHRDSARKALERIAKPALPATYTQLARAIEREASAYRRSVDDLQGRPSDEQARPDGDE